GKYRHHDDAYDPGRDEGDREVTHDVKKCRAILIGVLLVAVICSRTAAAEKLPAHPKLVYRQIGAGYLLARELGRTDQTFFLCGPSKTDCISTKEIGWRKPFIIIRSGALLTRSYQVIDTTGMTHRESSNY